MLSEKTINRLDCMYNAIITTFLAIVIWVLVEYLMTGERNPSSVDTVMLIIFFLYEYWRNRKEQK